MRKGSLKHVLAALLAASLFLAACSSDGGETTTTAGESSTTTGGSSDTTATTEADGGGTEDSLTVGVILVPDQWDPAGFNWIQSLQLQQAAYDSLIHLNPDGSFSPGLAAEWEYLDPTTFVFTLRDNVTFSDGTPVNADAVKANLDYFLETPGPRTSQLADVSDVESDGDMTVTVNLSQPNSVLPLVFSMAMGMMASPTARDAGELVTTPVGAGPYLLDESRTVVDDHYTFTKNPDYWDADNVAFEELTFRLIPDYTASLNALRSGEIDMALGEPTTVETAESSGATVVTYPGAVVMLVLSDREGQLVPALGDERVRKALNFAIDRDAIASSIMPGRPTSQFYAAGTEAYAEELDGTYALDLDQARSLMEEAGYADGFDLPVLSFPLNDPLVQVLAADLAEIGVNVQIESKPIADYASARYTQDYPTFIGQFTSQGTAYLDSIPLVLPDGIMNPFQSSNEEVNQAWAEGAAVDDAQRPSIYLPMGDTVQDIAWFLPVVQIDTYYYYNPDKVTGVVATPGQTVPLIYTWEPAS